MSGQLHLALPGLNGHGAVLLSREDMSNRGIAHSWQLHAHWDFYVHICVISSAEHSFKRTHQEHLFETAGHYVFWDV